MLKIFSALIVTCISLSGFAQSFEGVITFKKNTLTDTTHYKYVIKGNNVRIEEMGSKGNTTGIMLVDLKAGKVVALSPDRKLYMDVENSAKVVTGNPEVTKTKNTKEIAGYKCTQWRVKNKEQDTEISYYVADGKFDFFVPLLKTLNRKDKMASYFLQIPDNSGVFPMEATERTLLRGEKASLVVTNVEKKTVDAKQFEIPADYLKYDK